MFWGHTDLTEWKHVVRMQREFHESTEMVSVRNVLWRVKVCQSHTVWMKTWEVGPRSNQICFLYGKYCSGGDQLLCKTILDTGRNKNKYSVLHYWYCGSVKPQSSRQKMERKLWMSWKIKLRNKMNSDHP